MGGVISSTIVPRAATPDSGGGAVPGMAVLSFDEDFTSFEDVFPDHELGPSTGITLAQALAGMSESGGQWRINPDDMVSAGADADFELVLYLTQASKALVSMSFIMELISFASPRAEVMLGVYHLDGDPLVPTVPDNTTNFGTQGPFGGVGIGQDSSTFRYYRSRFETTPLKANLGLQFLQGEVVVDTYGLGTRLAHTLNNSIAGLDAGTSWSAQVQMGLRKSMSATHVLRPCLVINKEAVTTSAPTGVSRFNMMYNVP